MSDSAARGDLPRRSNPPVPRPVLSPRVTAVVATSALAVAVLVLVLLWRWTDRLGLPPDRVATAQLEAVKIAASVLVAAGGLYALYLTARRQRTQELELAQRDRVQEHAERVADDARDDARTRRTNDLYAKAVEQLGSEHHAVRHGAFYALEHLAQDNPDYRVPVVKVLCAYLRSPFTPPPDTPTTARPLGARRHRAYRLAAPRPTTGTPRTGPHASLLGRHQEHEVRLTAQRILADHLRPGPDPDHPAPTYWQVIGLDLTGATLIDFDLRHCRIDGTAAFTKSTFANNAWFDGVTFTGDAAFDGVTFTDHAMFNRVIFTGNAMFDEATFTGNAWFDRATFTDNVRFDGATFTGDAVFNGATFAKNTWFSRATFTGNAMFKKVAFADNAWFHGATFADNARFDGTAFTGDAVFNGATFRENVWFDGATFIGNAVFNPTTFISTASCLDAQVAVRRDRSDIWMEGWTVTNTGDNEWANLAPVPVALPTQPVDNP